MTRFDELSTRFGMPTMFNEHGETIRYRTTGKRPRSIMAMVDRDQPEHASSGGPNPGRQRPVITVTVRNSSKTGIAASEIDENGDEIELAARKGDSPRWRRIKRMPLTGQYGNYIDLEVH